jgi:hypothetical protein
MPDDPSVEVALPDDVPFQRLSLADLGLDLERYHQMATIYEPAELACACKPFALEAVRSRVGACAWVDSDMKVYAPLDEPDVLLDGDAAAVTPHLLRPAAAGEWASDGSALLMAGAFNAGFVVVGGSSEAFLAWWQEQLVRRCLEDHEQFLHTDQRWLDLASAYFPIRIIRDPTYNVAYWNAAQRGLCVKGERPMIEEARPVRLFHFSGFDPVGGEGLTSFDDEGSLRTLDQSVIAHLRRDYSMSLEREHLPALQALPYPFAETATGLRLDHTIRRLVREQIVRDEETGVRSSAPDPFTPDGARVLLDWLNEPVDAPGAVRLTRYAVQLWAHDDRDLRERFPRRGRELRWHLAHQAGLPAPLAEGVRRVADPRDERTVDALVARAEARTHEGIVGGGPLTRRVLLRALAYYEDEARRRDGRVVSALADALRVLDERVRVLEEGQAEPDGPPR